ncbi:transcription antitermination factor NusB [Shumkonia mesophila]|uniref:transcription antitermination factor NusB n=1 Tax=Shumkonia mesophila TaxID=2838854 RepID=UPI00293478A3|nr:transcription antitermination factor NusB [Shumkonia mesophila]
MTKSGRERRAKPEMSRRTAARLAAVQAIYEMEMAERSADAVLRDFAADRWAADGTDADAEGAGAARQVDPDAAFLGDLVRGTTARLADIDGMVAPALSADWPLDRLEAVLRAILRVGAYELFARADVPLRVIISEYVDIAHAFFDVKEAGLVNAVLDRVGRVLRPDEAGGGGDDPTTGNR